MKWALRSLAVFLALYLVFVGVVYRSMCSSPAAFNQFMAKLPPPAMFVVPFVPLWFHARAGALEVGQTAPDFELRQLHGKATTRLSAFRGQRPVLLVFGSYT